MLRQWDRAGNVRRECEVAGRGSFYPIKKSFKIYTSLCILRSGRQWGRAGNVRLKCKVAGNGSLASANACGLSSVAHVDMEAVAGHGNDDASGMVYGCSTSPVSAQAVMLRLIGN